MSYLHCHKCGWSQDDFWEFKIKWKRIFNWQRRPFGYNPLSLILEDISSWWKPRYILIDQNWAKENKLESDIVHSWWMLRHEVKRHYTNFRKQTWWTHKKFKKDVTDGIAECPSCGCTKEFDID